MTLLKSIVIPLGSKMPPFKLKDPFGKDFYDHELYGSKGLLLGFFCNHCPYAIAVWPRFIQLSEHAKSKDINTVAINPNIHPEYPEDAPDKMIEKIEEWKIPFPYLIDESQDVARAFKAQCTPDIFLFNAAEELVYHGRIDDHWKNEAQVKQEELKAAINNYTAGQPVAKTQNPSMGCSIKWRK